jgi:hypothetical protein
MPLVTPAVAAPTPWVAALVLVVVTVVALPELLATVPEVVSVAVQDRPAAMALGVLLMPMASVLALAAGVVVVTTAAQAAAVAAALDPAAVASTKISVPSRSKLHISWSPALECRSAHFNLLSFLLCFELLASVVRFQAFVSQE